MKALARLFGTTVFAFSVAACGGSSPEHPKDGHDAEGAGQDHGAHAEKHANEGGHGRGHEHGHDEKEHHHAKLDGALKAFHDVLAPVYHAEKGAGRNDQACAATASFKDGAGKVAAEPKGDAAAWKTDADTLTKTVGDLETACKGDKAGVEPALEKVHDAFHALMDKAKKAG